MNTIKLTLLSIVMAIGQLAYGQDLPGITNYWQIGFGLGELPMGGSFKPSITVGYHFNEKIYAGIIYQFEDHISRNKASINANAVELEGLVSTSEIVAQRFMFQLRYTPFKNGPYISSGFVFNGKDVEEMYFDERERVIGDGGYDGTVIIHQSRPAGWRFAVGIGYQYNFKNGFSTGFEWTPAWLQYPAPAYSFSGTSNLSKPATNVLKIRINKAFNQSVTNMYKVFHVGVAYRFEN